MKITIDVDDKELYPPTNMEIIPTIKAIRQITGCSLLAGKTTWDLIKLSNDNPYLFKEICDYIRLIKQ